MLSQGRAGWGEGGLGRACLALTGMVDLPSPPGWQQQLSLRVTGLTGTDLSLIITRLYEEIVAQGYTGTQRTLQMRLRPFRQKVARPVSKQTVIWDKPPSPRGVALMMVRPEQRRTREQTAYVEQLIQSNEPVAVVFKLAQDFGRLLRKREGPVRLEQWKDAVRTSGIAELIAFVDGLADDGKAVANGCTLIWSNGMTEGFVNKVKWIKRSSYGQAGFPLLQRRVLLHLAGQEPFDKEQKQHSSRRSASSEHQDASGARSAPTEAHIA